MLINKLRLMVGTTILLLISITNAHAFSLFNLDFWGNSAQSSTVEAIESHTHDLNPHVLQVALRAYNKLHSEGYDQQQMLTIIDYSKPSTEPRLWVIDLKDLQVPYHELVAHGQNSGGNVPDAFSDDPRSLESSIGVYLTGNTYFGKHGNSLRLLGLDRGFNDNAEAREIVIHAADYVSEQFAELHGRLGRSWGCMAVNPAVAQPIINNIKDGTVLVAYYPDSQWLHHSIYLQA